MGYRIVTKSVARTTKELKTFSNKRQKDSPNSIVENDKNLKDLNIYGVYNDK